MRDSRKILLVYFISVILPLLPFISLGSTRPLARELGSLEASVALGAGDVQKEYAAAAISTGDLLNPDKWFEILKRNITIPISKEQIIKIPTPEESLRQTSPQLKEISRGVREETGIDLAKLIGWFAKVLKVFFQVIVDLLETVAKSFD